MTTDDEDGEIPSVRLNPALVISAGCSLLADLARAVVDFCDTGALLLAAHHNWNVDQRVLHDQATQEIEMLTKGE